MQPSRYDKVRANPQALEDRHVNITCSWPGCRWTTTVTPGDKIVASIAFGQQHLEVAHRVKDEPDQGEELSLTEYGAWRSLEMMLRGESPAD